MSGKSNERLGFESLEAKQLLAGDVGVDVVGGNLLVRGDELDNQVAITSTDVPGSYAIVGLDGTTINGQERVVVEGVTRNARIHLGDGDDSLNIAHAHFRGHVGIGTGEGNDTVVLGGVTDTPTDAPSDAADAEVDRPQRRPGVHIGRSLAVHTGAGNDRVGVHHLAVGGSMRVHTGVGEDNVRLGLPRDADAPGNDAPVAAAVEDAVTDRHDRRPTLVVGRGLGVNLGDDNDHLALLNARVGHHTAINGGGGEDEIGVRHLGTRLAHVFGGRGDASDAIAIDHVRAHAAWIAAGGGGDKVAVQDSYFRLLGVSMGAGDDHLAIGGNHAHWALLSGGPGEDQIVRTSPNEFRRRLVVGFEQPGDDDAAEEGDGSELA